MSNDIPKSYQWIDTKLLQRPISDHRKYTMGLVLAPFLTNIQHLSYDEVYTVIKDWILKCSSLRRLEPSSMYFENKIKNEINNSLQKKILPIKKDTMQKKYPDWYNNFREWMIF